mmetsp:Transcript_30851/g.73509  ORF Transcript_30851/g.73509 Transcript_30851/m.73509 type:complete len:247 (-) Transcript_30851:383-1123(-)
MYSSRSATIAVYISGADFFKAPIITFTFSFAFMVSTKSVNSLLLMYTSSETFIESIPLFDDCRFCSESFISLGNKLSMLFSTSLSELISFLISVFVTALVNRFSVTSTSRSPSTIVEPSSRPSLTLRANSSPALKPSDSSFPYIPFIALPTCWAPALSILDCMLKGLDILASADGGSVFGVEKKELEAPDEPDRSVIEVDAPFCALFSMLLSPALPTRFLSSSTNTTSGLTSCTILPASSAELDEM